MSAPAKLKLIMTQKVFLAFSLQRTYEVAVLTLHKMKSWEVIVIAIFWPRCHRLILGIRRTYGMVLNRVHVNHD
eukprot:scaffold3291_cov80-Skeletonema_marinoi.AAC.2